MIIKNFKWGTPNSNTSNIEVCTTSTLLVMICFDYLLWGRIDYATVI